MIIKTCIIILLIIITQCDLMKGNLTRSSLPSLAPRCCTSGNNLIINKTCEDGSNFTTLSCPAYYLIRNDSNKDRVRIDTSNNLINYYNSVKTPNQYCVSRFNIAGPDIFLVCFDSNQETDNGGPYLLHAIFQFISVFFILLTIVVYVQVPDLLDLQGVCILHAISGLALTFIVLGTTKISSIEKDAVCLTHAYLIYFCSLYTFFWLNALSFHIWKTIVQPKCFNFTKYWAQIYHIYAIGGSFALLAFVIVANHSVTYFENIHPGLGDHSCWFKSTETQFIFFYGPMSVLLCLNIIYYGHTIAKLWKDINQSNNQKAKILKYKLILCIKLFFVMGITWIFEIISAALEDLNPLLDLCCKPKCFNFTKYWAQIYHIYAIGGSIALLAFLIIANHFVTYFENIHPGLGENSCWFKSMDREFIYFYGPISLLLCLNIIYYGHTIARLWSNINQSNTNQKAKILKYKLLLCVKLFFVMGITWIFEIISAALKDVNPILEVCWLITDSVNSLQGILIFLILVVSRKRVIRGLANRTVCGKRLPSKWRSAADDECEEIVEEFGLSESHHPNKI